MSPRFYRRPVSAPVLPEPGTELSGKLRVKHLFFSGNGFVAGRGEILQGDSYRGELPFAGSISGAKVGAVFDIRGVFIIKAPYGPQLQVNGAIPYLGRDRESIRAFLTGDSVWGIGESIAGRIVDTFGDRTLDVLDKYPEQLLKVKGVSEKKLAAIVDSYHLLMRKVDIRKLLRKAEIPERLADKILVGYGAGLAERIHENPYAIRMIPGVKFEHADAFAQAAGIAKDSQERYRAFIEAAVDNAEKNGNTVTSIDRTMWLASKQGLESSLVSRALKQSVRSGVVAMDGTNWSRELLSQCEGAAAARLLALVAPDEEARLSFPPGSSFDWKPLPKKAVLSKGSKDIELTDEQQDAVLMALRNPISIVTGAAGTGKTTVIKTIVRNLRERGISYELLAPTGAAVRRIRETVGKEGETVHRARGYAPEVNVHAAKGKESWTRLGFDEKTPLREMDAEPSWAHDVAPRMRGVVIVDETSMVDAETLWHLLAGVRSRSIIFVGDPNQLQSVGPGAILRDLIASGKFPVANLTVVKRSGDQIIEAANMVLRKENPALVFRAAKIPARLKPGYMHVECSDAQIQSALRSLIAAVKKTNLDPLHDTLTLSPQKGTDVGVFQLNRFLQDQLNPDGEKLPGTDIRIGDRVVQLRNDRDLKLWNGDSLFVTGLTSADSGLIHTTDRKRLHLTIDEAQEAGGKVSVEVDSGEGEMISYPHDEFVTGVMPAYCTTVHKAQGQESPVAIMVVSESHPAMLNQNLLYTGITRGRTNVITVGAASAVGKAAATPRTNDRRTRFADYLKSPELIPERARELERANAECQAVDPEIEDEKER